MNAIPESLGIEYAQTGSYAIEINQSIHHLTLTFIKFPFIFSTEITEISYPLSHNYYLFFHSQLWPKLLLPLRTLTIAHEYEWYIYKIRTFLSS